MPNWLTEPVTAIDCRIGTPAERRQQRGEFGQRGAVALDTAVGLLEHQARLQRQGQDHAET